MAHSRVGWRIWYDDGSMFDSGQGPWESAPDEGVLFVVETFDDGKRMVHMGSDYYLMRDGTIMDFSLAHLDRHLKLGIPAGSVKFGRWTSDEAFAHAHEEVFGAEP